MVLVKKRESGQALVLVLLSLSVILTIVLFILSRSITDIAISTSDEESVRAFSAAEAGIERALVLGPASGLIGDASYNVTSISVAEGDSEFNYLNSLASGDTATLWLVSHDANGAVICDVDHPCFSGPSMKVCWGEVGTPDHDATTPAVEITMVYNDGTMKIARSAFDSNDPRRALNGFSQTDASGLTCTVDGRDYEFYETINFADYGINAIADGVLQYVKVRMFYNSDKSQPIGFSVNLPGNDILPAQGSILSSTGTSGSSTRRVEVTQSYPEPPPIFDSVIFSSSGITK